MRSLVVERFSAVFKGQLLEQLKSALKRWTTNGAVEERAEALNYERSSGRAR